MEPHNHLLGMVCNPSGSSCRLSVEYTSDGISVHPFPLDAQIHQRISAVHLFLHHLAGLGALLPELADYLAVAHPGKQLLNLNKAHTVV